MPRKLRVHVPGAFYHVTLRGNHQRDIFVEEGGRHLLNHIVARAIDKYRARLHAYCWMSNHLHFLMQVADEPLAGPMRQIAAEFARAMQRKLETTGHFFERRYHAVFVEDESHLLQLMRYIHFNPVEARIVDCAQQFRWSSYHAYVGSRSESWLTTDFVLGLFAGDRRTAIGALVRFLQLEQPDTGAPALAIRPEPLAASPFESRPANLGGPAPPRQDLSGLIEEACCRFNVEPARLVGRVRDAYLVKVRAWIAHQARVRQIASLAAVSRALGRDEASLRESMRLHAGEID